MGKSKDLNEDLRSNIQRHRLRHNDIDIDIGTEGETDMGTRQKEKMETARDMMGCGEHTWMHMKDR